MSKPKVAVWKFSSCDGCQLSILDLEDQLLALVGEIDFAYFKEATSAEMDPPYDLSLVEGSVTIPEEIERIHEIRKNSKAVVLMGACATAGGIQSLRNYTDVNNFIPLVYSDTGAINTLEKSTPIHDHIKTEGRVQGCPPNNRQLLEAISAFLHGRRPNISTHSVCVECKMDGNVCVMVGHGTPCLGPVTHAGCGALCPSYHRGCYGCFGPMETPNTDSLTRQWRHMGVPEDEIVRSYRSFNGWQEPFREAAEAITAGTPAQGAAT